MTRTAAIYARISRDREGAGLGVERQREDCAELAARLGWQVVATHTDNDISAYSGKRRPGYRALLDDLRDGKVDAVLAWHTDRLHRSPVELEEFITVVEAAGAVVQTVKAGPLDLATPSGRMVARQLGVVARYEVEHSIERQRRAKLQAASEGRWKGGRRPFGYESDGVTVRESEALEVKRAAEALLTGTSLRALAADLNAREVRTSTGRAWKPTEVGRMLARPRNAGLLEHRGEVVGAAQWPAIVSEDVWRAVVGLLNDDSRRTTTTSARKWLGSGIYRCVCGSPVRSSTSGTSSGRVHVPAYACRAHKCVVRNARHVDELVEAVVVERLRRPDAVDLLAVDQADTAPLHVEAVALRGRLDELGRLYADGAVDARQLAEGTRVLRERLTDLERQIGDLSRGSVLHGLVGCDDIEKVWARLDLSRRRAVVETLVEVVILPAPRGRMPGGDYFDPASVEITWRKS